jgi:hypothetical protein
MDEIDARKGIGETRFGKQVKFLTHVQYFIDWLASVMLVLSVAFFLVACGIRRLRK